MSKFQKYTDDLIKDSVKSSTTWREVCEKLNAPRSPSLQRHIKERAKTLEIDFTHFPGKPWNKGKDVGVKVDTLEYLALNGRNINSHNLRLRLLKEGIKSNRCEICNLEEWCNRPIPLQLDHINGNRDDNRLENLRILCPNCHAQTENFAGKKNKKF